MNIINTITQLYEIEVYNETIFVYNSCIAAMISDWPSNAHAYLVVVVTFTAPSVYFNVFGHNIIGISNGIILIILKEYVKYVKKKP